MNVLLVTHTLKNHHKDYSSFFNALKTSCAEWWHYFDTAWIVITPQTADQFAKLLYLHMENPDRLLVVKLQKDYQDWLETDAWDWLNARNF